GGGGFFVEDALERSFYVGRGDLGTVGELGVGIELEGQRLGVWGEFPARGDGGDDVEIGVEADQRLIDQFEQANGREGGLLMRVEARRVLAPGHAERRCLYRQCDGGRGQRRGDGEPGHELAVV